MGRSYPGYLENISTSSQARSCLDVKKYEKLHCVHMRRKGKLSVYTLQNLRHSGKLYPESGKNISPYKQNKII